MGFQSEACFVFIMNHNLCNLKQFLFVAGKHKDCSYGTWIAFSTICYQRCLFVAEGALDLAQSATWTGRADESTDVTLTFSVGLSVCVVFFFPFLFAYSFISLFLPSAFQYVHSTTPNQQQRQLWSWYDVTGTGWRHYFPNPTSQSHWCRYPVYRCGSWSPLWLCSPSCQAWKGRESQQHCTDAGSPLCWQLCSTNLLCHSGQAEHTLPYITLSPIPRHRKVSNSMLRCKEKRNFSYWEAWSCSQWVPRTLLIMLLRLNI